MGRKRMPGARSARWSQIAASSDSVIFFFAAFTATSQWTIALLNRPTGLRSMCARSVEILFAAL